MAFTGLTLSLWNPISPFWAIYFPLLCSCRSHSHHPSSSKHKSCLDSYDSLSPKPPLTSSHRESQDLHILNRQEILQFAPGFVTKPHCQWRAEATFPCLAWRVLLYSVSTELSVSPVLAWWTPQPRQQTLLSLSNLHADQCLSLLTPFAYLILSVLFLMSK